MALHRYTALDPAVAARAGTVAHQRDDDPVMVYGEPFRPRRQRARAAQRAGAGIGARTMRSPTKDPR